MMMRNTKILSLLKKHPEGLDLGDIQQALEVKHRERTKLLEDLKEMQDAGLLRFQRKKYFLPAESGLVRGRFVTTRRGFGFVCRADKAGADIFVPARFAEGVIQGDEVEVLLHEKGKFGKPEGRIVRIVKRERTSIMGVYAERAGTPFLQAFDSPSPEDIALKAQGKGRPRPGMIVEVDRKTLAVSRVYGMPDDPGVDAEVIIRRFGLAKSFGEDALRESEAVPAALTDRDLEGRRDFRDWPSVTIDGEKAQDFDDAVSIRRLPGGGFRLGVHIADVSHYVRPGTALDAEAYARATSVYFPGLTLPMLPEKLSNDLCSLRPAVPRLTVSVLMDIDDAGRVVRSEFAPSVIKTAERMTYTSVFKVFEGDGEACRRYARLAPEFMLMREAAALLRARRVAEGSLDFDLVEPELVYEEGKLMAVAAAERNDAHRLIEEFMVAANVAVASFLTAKGVPTIYRVHPVPALADLEKLRDILAHLGYALPPADKVRSKDLARVLDKAKGKPEEKFVGIQVLRAMKIAVYDAENVGHYGLAKKDYTHFTSPIRRYPDLIVHRILKGYLACGIPGRPALDEAARHSSERERNAAEAEKALVEWRIFRFLRDRLGDEFEGIVVDVSKAGLVVELEDYFVDGLLPFSALREEFAPVRGGKKGRGRHFPARRTPRLRFELGDRLRVALVACDPILQRMTLVPADGSEDAR